MKWRTACTAWSLALLVGCASTPSYMVKAEEPSPDHPPPGNAMIVFMRFMTHRVRNDVIVDDEGRFVAQVPARAHVKHVTSPGFHRFVIPGRYPALVEADMVAGRTYFVSVWTGPTSEGAFTDRTSLRVVRRGGWMWDEIGRALRETEEWLVDTALLEEWREDERPALSEQLQRMDALRSELSEAYGEEGWREFAVLRPEDGR